jgi:uncharacterized protein (DUF433 family)
MTSSYQHLDKKLNGRMRIVGTRLYVSTILGYYEMGYSPEYMAENGDVPLAAVFEALAYAYDHPEEMEAFRQEEVAAQQLSLDYIPKQFHEYLKESRKTHERDLQELTRKVREARLDPPVS